MHKIEEDRETRLGPGELLLRHGHWREAMPFILKSYEENPHSAAANSNISSAYRNDHQFDLALHHAQEAIILNPDMWAGWHNKARVLEDLGRFDEALECYRKSCEVHPYGKPHLRPERPEHTIPRMGLAFALMRQGRFEEAFPYWQDTHPVVWLNNVPPWDGKDLSGKRIFVMRQGGYGDIFWLLRYLKPLKERGAHVTFFGMRKQRLLLQGHPWIDRYLDADDMVYEEEFDYQIPLMFIMGIVEGYPMGMSEPYLQGNKSPYEGVNHMPTVGICWTALESGHGRKFRSVNVVDIELLKEVPVQWVALELGDCPDWMIKPSLEEGWHQTAELISGLDLVVSVDTAVCHLAGAMMKPVWTMVPLNSDHKWFLNTDNSPFYPTMTVFRNDNPYTMAPAVKKVAEALRGPYFQSIGDPAQNVVEDFEKWLVNR